MPLETMSEHVPHSIFMKEHIYEYPNGKHTIISQIIKPKFLGTRIFFAPACESCMLACSKNKSTGTTTVYSLPDKKGALTRANYDVGYFVSTDQFICNTPG